MITLACKACQRPLLVAEVTPTTPPSRLRFKARCGYAGCGGESFWRTVDGKVHPLGYFDGKRDRTDVVGVETSDSGSDLTFITRPTSGH